MWFYLLLAAVNLVAKSKLKTKQNKTLAFMDKHLGP